jgi:hypothetical protein
MALLIFQAGAGRRCRLRRGLTRRHAAHVDWIVGKVRLAGAASESLVARDAVTARSDDARCRMGGRSKSPSIFSTINFASTRARTIAIAGLSPQSVAEFTAACSPCYELDHRAYRRASRDSAPVRLIWITTQVIDPAVARWWKVVSRGRGPQRVRREFIGKSSPVLFWGSFDHAVTRFGGRRAPEREGADAMTKEACRMK